MALGTVKPLFSAILVVAYLSVLGPVAFIYAMIYLRILFWPFLLLPTSIVYLLAEKLDGRKPRRRWKFWEPENQRERDPFSKR